MRTMLRVSTATATAALLVTVAACGPDTTSTDTAPTPSASTSPTATADPTETPTAQPTTKPSTKPNKDTQAVCATGTGDMKPFTGPAALKFGADNVMDAYCEIADFFYTLNITQLTPPQPKVRAEQLSFVNDYLTPSAGEDWAKIAKGVEAGDRSAHERALALTLVDVQGMEQLGLSWPDPDQPGHYGGGVSPAETTVVKGDNGRDYLILKFTVHHNLSFVKGDKPVALPFQRDVAVTLQQNSDPATSGKHSWLIGRWETHWSTGKVKPLEEVLQN